VDTIKTLDALKSFMSALFPRSTVEVNHRTWEVSVRLGKFLANGDSTNTLHDQWKDLSKEPQAKREPAYRVGQVVWVLDTMRNRRIDESTPLREATITDIGRKWATLDGDSKDRFDIKNGLLDGGEYTSPGRVFVSPSAFYHDVQVTAAWSALTDAVRRHQPPEGIPLEFLQETVRRLTEK
jgi:hypothetical protein